MKNINILTVLQVIVALTVIFLIFGYSLTHHKVKIGGQTYMTTDVGNGSLIYCTLDNDQCFTPVLSRTEVDKAIIVWQKSH